MNSETMSQHFYNTVTIQSVVTTGNNDILHKSFTVDTQEQMQVQ